MATTTLTVEDIDRFKDEVWETIVPLPYLEPSAALLELIEWNRRQTEKITCIPDGLLDVAALPIWRELDDPAWAASRGTAERIAAEVFNRAIEPETEDQRVERIWQAVQDIARGT